MTHKRIGVFFLLLLLPLTYVDAEYFLKVESGTHTSVISNLMVTSDGKYVVSTSDDKSIRIWNAESGKESRKILGQIGEGPDGSIHATALSADDKYLAVVVHRGETHNKASSDDSKDIIRLYDFATGKLIKILNPNNSDDVLSVSFSEDGVFLLSGSEDHSIHIWKMSDVIASSRPTPLYTIKNEAYFQRPHAISIFRHGNDYRIVSADYNEFIRKIVLYSLNEKRILNTFTDADRLQYMAVSDRYIAVCGYSEHILIFDINLNHIKTIKSTTQPAGLAFSPDGKLLLAGSKETTDLRAIIANVYDAESNFSKITSYEKHDARVQSVAFLDNNTAITGGGSKNEIHFWDARSGRTQKVISSNGSTVFGVGASNGKIAFGNTQNYQVDKNNYSPLERVFDLIEFETIDKPSAVSIAEMKRAQATWQGQKLYVYPGPAWDLFVKRDNRDYRVWRNGWYYHEAYGFTEKGYIMSGGRGSEVRGYELPPGSSSTRMVTDFVGHTARVWDLAVSGNWLVTGGEDQTIKLWNLTEMEAGKKVVHPALNLFVSTDGEWIIWSKSGYYNASLNGDKYIGYHVNQGEDKEALFYASDRFLKTLYRPDIIRLILETGSEELALKKAAESVARIADILPPKIELYGERTITTDRREMELKFNVTPEKGAVRRIWVLQNGKVVWKKSGDSVSRGGRFAESISLEPGENRLEIYAENRAARSNPVSVVVTVDSKEWFERGRIGSSSRVTVKKEQPNLFLLAIGVSQYKHAGAKLNNLNFAHKDAIAVVNAFQTQSGKAYGKVISKTLINQNADKSSIENGFAWLASEIKKRTEYKRKNNIISNDITLVFLAGHGVREGEEFYLLGHDADPDNLRATGVRIMDQGSIVTAFPTELVIMTDACHSGTIGGGLFNNIDAREINKRLVALNERSIYIINASKKDKPSLENTTIGHGVFTNALLQGLTSDHKVYIQPFISFVRRSVKKLTRDSPKGVQEPHVTHYGEYADYIIHQK